MNIGIIGAGFVGLTFAAVLGSKKYNVILMDSDTKKIKKISAGKTSFYEPKLKALLQNALKKSLSTTSDINYIVNNCDIIFITVGTPTLKDGKIDLANVKSVINRIALSLKKSRKSPIIAIKSTIIPGSSSVFKEILEKKSKKKLGQGFGLVTNPEFLSEGKAVEDTLNPHIVVIGGYEKEGINKIKNFYIKLYGKKVPYVITNPQTSEMIKYANNSFLATKISFINQLANICQNIPGINVDDIARAIGLDPRIGSLFLRAGPGYGGSCLQKDVSAFITFSTQIGQDPTLLRTVQKTNKNQILNLISLIEKVLGKIKNKKITILGLSFKEESDDVRESVSIKLIDQLLKRKSKIIAHDPAASKNTKTIFGNKIVYANSVREALKNSECVVIMTPWKSYSKLSDKDFKIMRKRVIIDTRRLLTNKKLNADYYATGVGKQVKIGQKKEKI